jgi:hypothetical protein
LTVIPQSPLQSGLFVLKDSTTNKKLGSGGRLIRKGRYRGMALYSLTLEERATCWQGCPNLEICYGDNMPFAKRHEPGPELEAALKADVATLAERHPAGFVVRLHVLGDFYSTDYVAHWASLLDACPQLRIFGYTHWPPGSPIGKAVTWLVQQYQDRVAIRRSNRVEANDPLPPAYTVPRDAEAIPGTVLCPEQTGRTASCTTCGLCMDLRTGISFLDHSRQKAAA